MNENIPDLPVVPNELAPDLLGVTAMNPFPGQDSSSRAVMMSSHVGQALVVDGADIRRIQTGVEREYAKYTFSLKMPCNASILRVIHKYPPTMADNVKENPVTAVIYEDMDHPQRQVGVIELVKFHCLHQTYGFRYQYRPVLDQLVPGNAVPKGTIIADSPTVTEDGDYRYGVESNVALMSYQPVIEDGVIASDEYLKKLTATAYGSRTISWGKDRFPLNIFGDENNYKPFPDIGDRIGPDGLLFALREYDELLAPCQLAPACTREVDHVFDKTVYAEANARVVDVIVHKGNQPKSNLPSGMTAQAEKYFQKEFRYYESLIAEYYAIRRKQGGEVVTTPELHRLLVEALAFTDSDRKNKVSKLVNKNPLDEWCVEIVYEYKSVPTVGSKLTDLHGG